MKKSITVIFVVLFASTAALAAESQQQLALPLGDQFIQDLASSEPAGQAQAVQDDFSSAAIRVNQERGAFKTAAGYASEAEANQKRLEQRQQDQRAQAAKAKAEQRRQQQRSKGKMLAQAKGTRDELRRAKAQVKALPSVTAQDVSWQGLD